MELRTKIAAEIRGEFGGEFRDDERALVTADAILALPEIKEAMALRKLREASPTRAPIPVLSPMEAVRKGSTLD
jgi:hypothetical protein